MKIVIDIPESIYDTIMDDKMISREQLAVLEKHIYYGTPLPKGHGRLIDADSMKSMKNIQSANFNAVALIRLWIDKQDTILEADKAESEDKA